jgi:hypothetical protein
VIAKQAIKNLAAGVKASKTRGGNENGAEMFIRIAQSASQRRPWGAASLPSILTLQAKGKRCARTMGISTPPFCNS